MQTTGNLSLYIHLPFCQKKCSYCHFYVLPNTTALHNKLYEGISIEWDLWRPNLANYTLNSIYFGGGTPSLFPHNLLESILEKILSSMPCDPLMEITLEVNPEMTDYQAFLQWRQIGINRLSLGAQSFSDPLLNFLGREHLAKDIHLACNMAHKAGFDNISLDLMYDIPNQSVSTFNHSINQATQLPITHVSLYNLTFEPHTVFYKYRDTLQKKLPSESESLSMYKLAQDVLSKKGMLQYEISAFCLPECEGKHNIGYWTAREFVGLGPSACTFFNKTRYKNTANIHRYLRDLHNGTLSIESEDLLDFNASEKERLVLRLRYLKPFSIDTFTLDDTTLKAIDKLVKEGLIIQSKSTISLSQKGIIFHDYIAENLI